MIEKFVELGERLRGFGGDDLSRDVMRRAIEQNPWFTEEDILRAVDAIVVRGGRSNRIGGISR